MACLPESGDKILHHYLYNNKLMIWHMVNRNHKWLTVQVSPEGCKTNQLSQWQAMQTTSLTPCKRETFARRVKKTENCPLHLYLPVPTTNLLSIFSNSCFSFNAIASPFRLFIRFFSSFFIAYILPLILLWHAQTFKTKCWVKDWVLSHWQKWWQVKSCPKLKKNKHSGSWEQLCTNLNWSNFPGRHEFINIICVTIDT